MAPYINEGLQLGTPTSSLDVHPSFDKTWWKNGTVYQIYPSCFKDSNGDGIGDIPGIISKLDYIKDLGIDIVWLCPMYESPQIDMGYDISNYEDVHKPYGSVADMDDLIQGCHDRGMRLVIDLVVNHTSDQHQWFKESRSSKNNPKRDWYIWRPAKYDVNGHREPPNNWRSNFGGSVWQWDEATEEYYMHLFAPEQPDLNWESPAARNAIYQSAMEFWLQKGVDGFRVDTVNMYSKAPGFPDAPVVDLGSQWQGAADYYCNGPRMHEYLQEMNDKVLSRYDCMTVGELPWTPNPVDVLAYISAAEKQLNMVFQFDAVDLGIGKHYKYDTKPFAWTLPEFKSAMLKPQELTAGTDAWNTVFLENHDQGRSISRFGSDEPAHRSTSGKMLAIMLTSLSGTLFIYQGQEIGMTNCPKSWSMEDYQDIESNNYYQMVKEKSGNDEAALAEAHAAIQHLARDHARLPMQWDGSLNAGFSTGKPWIRLHDSYKDVNVERESRTKDSLLRFWKNMLALRKEYAAILIHGRIRVYDLENPWTFTFAKTSAEGATALVVLNFSKSQQTFSRPKDINGRLKLLSSNMQSSIDILEPFEGRLYLVE